MFEGIGTVMPIMNASNDAARKKFPKLIFAALATLILIYVTFSSLCYFTFGNNLNEAIIVEMLPAQSKVIQATKILFCINILFSYVITIYPTNQVLQGLFFSKFDEDTNSRRVFNAFGSLVILILGFTCAITFYSTLDRFLGVSGVLIGCPVILIIPCLCHYMLLSRNGKTSQKAADIFIILYAIILTITILSA
jgi:amino acid permease